MTVIQKILRERSFSPIERIILIELLTCGSPTYTHKTLAETLSIGQASIEKALPRLIKMQVVTKEMSKGRHLGYTVNLDEKEWRLYSKRNRSRPCTYPAALVSPPAL